MTDLEIGKVNYILTQKYNIFHADLIARAIQDDSMSIEDFWSGCLTIDAAEFIDDDEHVPAGWENV